MSVSVLLVGAGGSFGQPLLQELIYQRRFFTSLGVLVSNEIKANKLKWTQEHGVIVRIGSFLESSSYQGFTHVLCVVGNPVLCLQPAMISAAIAAGVTHFYPSEWNSDISQKSIYNMRYFREKQVVRSYLATQVENHPNFKYTLFITGIFTEWSILEFYGFNHTKHEVVVYGRPNARVGMTAIPDIVRCTVLSLLVPFQSTKENGSERTIRITGCETTFQGIIEALNVAKGVKYKIYYRDPAEAAAKEEKARLDGDTLGEMMWSIRPLLASGFGVADGTPGSRLDNELFDFIPESIEATFARMIPES